MNNGCGFQRKYAKFLATIWKVKQVEINQCTSLSNVNDNNTEQKILTPLFSLNSNQLSVYFSLGGSA